MTLTADDHITELERALHTGTQRALGIARRTGDPLDLAVARALYLLGETVGDAAHSPPRQLADWAYVYISPLRSSRTHDRVAKLRALLDAIECEIQPDRGADIVTPLGSGGRRDRTRGWAFVPWIVMIYAPAVVSRSKRTKLVSAGEWLKKAMQASDRARSRATNTRRTPPPTARPTPQRGIALAVTCEILRSLGVPKNEVESLSRAARKTSARPSSKESPDERTPSLSYDSNGGAAAAGWQTRFPVNETREVVRILRGVWAVWQPNVPMAVPLVRDEPVRRQLCAITDVLHALAIMATESDDAGLRAIEIITETLVEQVPYPAVRSGELGWLRSRRAKAMTIRDAVVRRLRPLVAKGRAKVVSVADVNSIRREIEDGCTRLFPWLPSTTPTMRRAPTDPELTDAVDTLRTRVSKQGKGAFEEEARDRAEPWVRRALRARGLPASDSHNLFHRH